MINQITKQFEYNLWANLQLIDICQPLTPEQLAYQIKGAPGSLKETLAHIVSGEGAYVRHLCGKRPWADDTDFVGMDLKEMHAKALIGGQRLIELAAEVDPSAEHLIQDEEGTERFFNWTVLLQALYHGIEHRTQIKMMLTHLGIPHRELSSWDYNQATVV